MDVLVERARTQFGTRTPEGRVKALNYLLPHIRHIPNGLLRTQVARDVAQKLGIESGEVMQELQTAASQRLESVRAPQPRAISEVERVLLCALALPEADSARQLAATELGAHPAWYEGTTAASVMEALIHAPVPDNPLAAAPDEASRALLASALHHGSADDSPEAPERLYEQVTGALRTLHERSLERRLRELRTMIGEAQRRNDNTAMMQLAHEKLQIDRELRAL
jgi:DNA primase